MTQGEEVKVSYMSGEVGFTVPLTGDLARLFALDELRELKIHGKNLLFKASEINQYLTAKDSAITTEVELAELLESKLSKEDTARIHESQLRSKLVGQQFAIDEVGNFTPAPMTNFKLIVPEVKIDIKIIELAIDSISNDPIDKYVSFLPPSTEEEKINPVKCVSGNTLRFFLNSMQTEEGQLDMNSQIRVYCSLLTNLPDDDPTKMLALTQFRHLMVYGDVVSNKNLRLALTKVVTTRND